MIPHNPASMIDVAPAKPKKWKPRTMEQVRAFITTCRRYETLYDPLWLVMLGTSCRIGEALAIHEDKVNWDDGLLSIETGIVRIGTERRESDPKTEKGIRKTTLPGFALDALKHRRQFVVDGYLFRTSDGTVPWTSDLQKRLREACSRASVPEQTSHGLRKMGSTLAIAGGVDVKTVQNRLGHATLALTLGLYTEAMEMGDAKAAQALDTLLGHGSIPAQPKDKEAAND